MKKHLLTITLMFVWLGAFAQPQGINYQGVARDSVGHPVLNQNISLRLSIRDGSSTGSAVYVETQNAVTSGSGLFNVSIGMGSVVSGVFANVPWGAGDKWLKVEMDLGGGSNYMLMGATQFLSVPYAMYALNSSSSLKTLSQPIRLGIPTNTTWTCPQGVNQITVELWGAGGGGAGGKSNSYGCTNVLGGSGGRGGYIKDVINVLPGNIYQISIGLGGIAGANGNCSPNPGGDGGASIFGNNLLVATGGKGGKISNGGNGADGLIQNCAYSSTYIAPSFSRSFIPVNMQFSLNPNSCSANGGNGGNPNVLPIISPTQGEDGFCIIIY